MLGNRAIDLLQRGGALRDGGRREGREAGGKGEEKDEKKVRRSYALYMGQLHRRNAIIKHCKNVLIELLKN